MKIAEIEITNFKSINNTQKLKFEEDVTQIIGKNESGKSNILQIIKCLNINETVVERYQQEFSQKNHSSDLNETIVKIVYKLNKDEKELLKVENEYTELCINSHSNPPQLVEIISGFNKEYFETDKYNSLIENLESILIENSSVNHTYYNQVFGNNGALSVFKCMNKIHRRTWEAQLTSVTLLCNSITNPEKKEECENIISLIKEYILKLYSTFPIIVEMKGSFLKNYYAFNSKENIDQTISTDLALKNLLEVSHFNTEKLKRLIFPTNVGEKKNLKSEFNRLIDQNFNSKFRNFYKQEDVSLEIDVNGNKLEIFVVGTGGYNEFSERSQGLKWYISMFLEIFSHNSTNNSIILLLDEPGVHLHVDAQLELLSLFYSLESKYQLLYSTHSPFMLNVGKLKGIRAIQKNEYGESIIINNINNDKINEISKKETLSPINNAIGMKNGYIFGINDKKINIVTEGFSDALYYNAMAKKLKFDDFNFIGSIGANQVINILSILQSWGIKCFGLYDGDKIGYKEQQKTIQTNILKAISLRILNDEDIKTVENLFSEEDYNKLAIEDPLIDKVLVSQKMSTYIAEDGEVSDFAIDNFTRLFRGILDSSQKAI
ncbi:AAA family ATPase [Macrococcus capreoli]